MKIVTKMVHFQAFFLYFFKILHQPIRFVTANALPVNLCAGWSSPRALGQVTVKNGPGLHVLQAKLAKEQLRQLGVLLVKLYGWIKKEKNYLTHKKFANNYCCVFFLILACI